MVPAAMPVVVCTPVTWSIDTSGLPHPGRTAVAARRAVAEWQAATGIRFAWVPAGGQVGIVFHRTDPRWLAYTAGDAIVVDPIVAHAAAVYQVQVLAHELGHTLGVGHEGSGLMGGNDTRVTAADAALVTAGAC